MPVAGMRPGETAMTVHFPASWRRHQCAPRSWTNLDWQYVVCPSTPEPALRSLSRGPMSVSIVYIPMKSSIGGKKTNWHLGSGESPPKKQTQSSTLKPPGCCGANEPDNAALIINESSQHRILITNPHLKTWIRRFTHKDGSQHMPHTTSTHSAPVFSPPPRS